MDVVEHDPRWRNAAVVQDALEREIIACAVESGLGRASDVRSTIELAEKLFGFDRPA